MKLKILAVLLLAFASTAKAGPGTNPGSTAGIRICTNASGDGVPVCNCTKDPLQVQLCHSVSVEVTIGSKDIGSFSTGFSDTVCATQTVSPGQCIRWHYDFNCCYNGWWSGWSCDLVQSSVVSSRATCSAPPSTK